MKVTFITTGEVEPILSLDQVIGYNVGRKIWALFG